VGGGDVGLGQHGVEEREEVGEVVLHRLPGKEAVVRCPARPISMCTTQWLTAMSGFLQRSESARAAAAATWSGPPMRGALV
jgi:hypothetical protein